MRPMNAPRVSAGVFASVVLCSSYIVANRSVQPHEYAGSDACGRCHTAEYAQWKGGLHLEMTRPAGETRVRGDFTNGATLDAYGRSYRFDRQDGRHFMAVSHGGRPAERFEVHFTLGAKRVQGYLSRLPDGRIYVLPAFWHIADGRWIDWKEITPLPDGDHDVRQIWNITCFNCHATNLANNYDVDANTYDTSWTEMGIGCEACHGPGGPHVALMNEWQRNPAAKPAYDASRSNRDLGRILRVFSPRTASSRQSFDACSYCHGNKNNYFLGFRPGERMEEYALPFLVSQPLPQSDRQGEFWADGRPSRFNRPQALTLSGCFNKGEVTCTNCHVAHGSRHEHSLKLQVRDNAGVTLPQSDALCTQCHERDSIVDSRWAVARPSGDGPTPPQLRSPDSHEPSTSDPRRPTIDRHSHHAPASSGSRCIECHMSDVNWRLLTRRRDHSFASPVPELTAKYGIPNGCTTCHDNKPPEWAARAMDRWYGDRQRRGKAVRQADAFYAAAAGDADALPGLASIAVDRSRGMLARCSAAEYIGRLLGAAATTRGQSQTGFEGDGSGKRATTNGGTGPRNGMAAPRILNALIAAASDPEPTVRAMAVKSLAAARDPKVLPVLTARLVDEVRIVRVHAAEALLHLGVVTLQGSAGVALARAQDEYGESLRSFPDRATSHTDRGWLELSRGRREAAERAFDAAVRVDPGDLRPRVFRGVAAARAGEYERALQEWRFVKNANPAYPNIDALIAEAEKHRPR